MRRCLRVAALVALAPGAACIGGPNDATPELSLAVAASLTNAVQELGERFAAERGVEVVYNFAGSGTLAQQLMAAPRADVFLSASESWMDEVESAGLLVSGTRSDLLSNSLAIVAGPASTLTLDAPAALCDADFRYLSIGAPESVPAGQYAQRWLEALSCPGGGDVWSAVQARVAPAPDVRAALNQVIARRDVVGIVYRTDFLARRADVRLLYEAGAGEGPPIRLPVAVLAASDVQDLARDFVDFLAGPEAMTLFVEHGFRPARQS